MGRRVMTSRCVDDLGEVDCMSMKHVRAFAPKADLRRWTDSQTELTCSSIRCRLQGWLEMLDT